MEEGPRESKKMSYCQLKLPACKTALKKNSKTIITETNIYFKILDADFLINLYYICKLCCDQKHEIKKQTLMM